MKLSEIYLRAAELIREVDVDNPSKTNGAGCCCHAIKAATGNARKEFYQWKESFQKSAAAEDYFDRLFNDDDQSGSSDYWWADPLESNTDQEARRLALLFAHEIAKDEGL
jgi:hypothetical protein